MTDQLVRQDAPFGLLQHVYWGNPADAATTNHYGPLVAVGLTTIEEVDGTPTDSAVTKLVLPNGTLSITAHVATYTPSAAALGSWQTYTPAWTSDGTAPAIGNGTLSGRYRLLDASSMQINIQFIRGSTSTNGTGTYQFSMPSGYKASGLNQVISARLLDAGTAHYSATGYIDAGTTAFYGIIADATGSRLFAHTQPITLATSDEWNLNGVIEYAVV